MSAIAPDRLAEVFVQVADTLVDDFDLVEFPQTLTAHTTELTGFEATGLLLAGSGHDADHDDDRLHFMAASDERTHLLELFQIQADEGPCRDCYHQGMSVSSSDLRRADARWPSFAPAAVGAGFNAVHAFPLRLRRQVIGVVGLFSTTAVTMTDADARVVQALADVATIAILQQRTIRHGQDFTRQLQGALSSRVFIEQAKGVVSQLYRVSIDDAFILLRSYCRSHHLRLSDLARAIVTDPTTAPDLRPT